MMREAHGDDDDDEFTWLLDLAARRRISGDLFWTRAKFPTQREHEHELSELQRTAWTRIQLDDAISHRLSEAAAATTTAAPNEAAAP